MTADPRHALSIAIVVLTTASGLAHAADAPRKTPMTPTPDVASSGPAPSTELKALLPATLGAWRRKSFGASLPGRTGIEGSSANAVYQQGKRHVQLTITDLGGMAALSAMAGAPVERQTDAGSEKIYKDGERTVREQFNRLARRSELAVTFGNGLVAGLASDDGVDLAQLKQLLAEVPLDRIEAYRKPAR